MNTSKSVQPVRGSTSARPIMVVFDVLGRRGALRILWELRRDPLSFRALQQACETNPGSLNTRLRELRELAIIEHDNGGYRLTAAGRELAPLLMAIYDWAELRVAETPKS